jgi:hypothetical protein
VASVIWTTLSRKSEVASIEARSCSFRRTARFVSPANSTSRIASGSPISARVDHGTERRIAAREVDHRAIDELDGGGTERDDVAACIPSRGTATGS